MSNFIERITARRGRRPDDPDRSQAGGRRVALSVVVTCLLVALLVMPAALAGDTGLNFDPNPNERVQGVAYLDDGRILIHGRFTQIGGEDRRYVALLDGEGQPDPEFVPVMWPSGGSVKSVAVQHDGKILIAGWFSTIIDGIGQAPTGLARLNTDGTVDTDFQVGALDGPANSVVIMEDNRIYVGGSFSTVGGQTRRGIARLHEDGSLDEGFTLGLGNGQWVEQLAALHGNRLLVAGRFTSFGGEPRAYLVRLQGEGEIDIDFNPVINENVIALGLSDHSETILIGGMFTEVNGEQRKYIARLQPDGTNDPDFSFEASASGDPLVDRVYSLAIDNEGRILVGGNFTHLAGEPRNFVGRLDPQGTLDPDFDPNPNGAIVGLAVHPEGDILIAGEFSQVGGQPRASLARLNADGSLDNGSVPVNAVQPRNDTGQVTCHDTAGAVQPCNAPGYPGLDGHYGRDAAAVTGALPKVGGGTGGFDFTKIANNGSDLPESAALGTAPGDWACTRDNVTGQLWEIKIADANSPRNYQWAFHWYDTDDEHNGGDPGATAGPGPACGWTMDCYSEAYIDYINELALCGRTDWRLPSIDEFQGIVNFGSAFATGGAMDRIYFADGGGYSGYGGGWTGDTAVDHDGHHAWAVNFDDGHAADQPKGALQPIRLVSGPRNETSGTPPVCGERENLQIRPSTAGAYLLGGALVTDIRTGLVWDRCPIGHTLVGSGPDSTCEGEIQDFNWQEAMQEVKARNHAGHLGHSDWRLPNMKELASLVERRCAMPVTDLRVFPLVDPAPYWSSTTYTPNPSFAFAITIEFGHQVTMPKDFGQHNRIRLVRGGGPFDGHSGTPGYSVGGVVNGMLGGNLVLRLQSPGTNELLTVDNNGDFVFISGLLDDSDYTVTVDQPPVPHQVCSVVNGVGTIGGGDVHTVQVSCAMPPPAIIEVDPGTMSFDVVEGSSTSGTLAIGNAGGGILDWSIQTAFPASTNTPAGSVDCAAAPGILINDDGTAETAYTGNAAWLDGVIIVDRFQPASYPASISAACISLAGSVGASALSFEIVVFDDNGPGGSPGTELAALAATATGIPAFPPASPVWFGYDLSSLYTTVQSGSLYVGIRYHPVTPSIFVLADQSDDRPAGHAGGHVWNFSGQGLWQPTLERFPDYRANFIRAVAGGEQAPPVGCDAPNAVPWLSVSPASGNTFAGESDDVTVTINASGIAPGDYSALLCVNSSDPATPRVEVPVELTVEVFTLAPRIEVAPPSLDFTLVQGASGNDAISIGNTGEQALVWQIDTALPTAERKAAIARANRVATNLVASGGAMSMATQPLHRAGHAAMGDRGTIDCSADPDRVIHDDGSIENGYSANPATVSQLRLVDRFVPAAYPATVTSVCVAFLTMASSTVDYSVVVYDDDGAGGAPGTRLGSLSATALGIPSSLTPVWHSVDLSALDLLIESGSVYIGVEYSPQGQVFVASDESAGQPAGYAGGWFWNNADDAWVEVVAAWPGYRALFIRAALPNGGVTPPIACDTPASVPWLNLPTTSGTTAPGANSPVPVTATATGLAAGSYSALLCVESNDGFGNGQVEVPVSLTVTSSGPVFPAPYCPVTVSNTIEPITLVAFTGIDNRSPEALGAGGPHENFLAVGAGTVAAGSIHQIAVEGNTDGNYTNHVRVFLDWNRDGVLNGAGESYYVGTIVNSTGVDGTQAVNTIQVPAGLVAGPVRMRVVKMFSTDPTDPCAALTWGQAEDYTVEVTTGGPPQSADLSVTAFGVPAQVPVGEPVSFAVTVGNAGPDLSSGVQVEVDLPDELVFTGGSLVQGSGIWTCAATGGTVSCDLASGTLPVSPIAAVLQIDVDSRPIASAGTVTTVFSVSGQQLDPVTGNDQAMVTTELTVDTDTVFGNGFECAPGYPDCTSGGEPGVYDTLAAFMANVQGGSYAEDFSGVPVEMAVAPLIFSQDGFAYSVYSSTAFDPVNQTGGLYRARGLISVNSATDGIVITFTSGNITAVGGNFWATDINMLPPGTSVVLELADGTTETITGSPATSFRGFVSETPITRLSIDAPDAPSNAWPAMDNLVVGSR